MENTVGLPSSPSPPPADLPSSRKRKRPPMLEIPVVPEAVAEVPEPDLEVAAEGFGWAVFSKRGRRKRSMEDFYCAQPHKGFFAVFDGHGGKEAAAYAAKNLYRNIATTLERCQDLHRKDAIRAAFLKTNLDLLEKGTGSGSCAVTALIGKDDIAISNLGDCRAVLCRGGVAEALTTDHTAKNAEEQKKVEEKGGFIQDHHGICRVQGILAVTRSFGDRQLKEYLSVEPDTILIPHSSSGDFLILASDGIWDKVGNQEVVDAIIHYYNTDTWKNFMPRLEQCIDVKDTYLKKSDEKKQEKETEIDSQKNESVEYGVKSKKMRRLKFGSENIKSDDVVRRRGMQCQQKINSLQKTKMNNDISSPQEVRRIILSEHHHAVIKEFKDGNSLSLGTKTDNESRLDSENRILSLKMSKIASFDNQWKGSRPSETDPNVLRITPDSRSLALGGACKEVANIALNRGSNDDITIMIVDLKHFKYS